MWLPQGKGEHELTRKGIDNVTYIVNQLYNCQN